MYIDIGLQIYYNYIVTYLAPELNQKFMVTKTANDANLVKQSKINCLVYNKKHINGLDYHIKEVKINLHDL